MTTRGWTLQDAEELYQIPYWGAPYFAVGPGGNLAAHPSGTGASIDVKALIDDLRERGIDPPILLRFNDILAGRVRELADAFGAAREEYGYTGPYTGVLPIKVNQQRHVIEEVVSCSEKFGFGLEAGSKPELLIAIAQLGGEERPIVCNGYKDREYIETALLSQGLGGKPFLVVDRFQEVSMVIEAAQRLGVTPHVGLRAKLASRGSGKWQESGGVSSKFGLSSSELLRALEAFKRADMLESVELLHFHIGSQITSIRSVKDAIAEAARLYVDLRDLGATNLTHIDVGGGLAVDYDGSQTSFHSSRNYSMQEYANDIVWTLKETCDSTGHPHPVIFSESGRALVAHHAVLIFNVLGVHKVARGRMDADRLKPADDDPPPVHAMWDALKLLSVRNVKEAYNDALQLAEESATLFRHGHLDLSARAKMEDLFWALMTRVQQLLPKLDFVPEQFEKLDRFLCDTVYCNFSVFQSLPDAWAVSQLFPILPLHRLNERPTRPSVLADLTCDSDGCVGQFIDLRDVRDTLLLHEDNGEPYYLGAFLVGAYQETLGDLHNLFGDTNVVHVSLQGDGTYGLEHLVEGDRVDEVLSYVEYERADLVRRVRRLTEGAVRAGRLTLAQSRAFMRSYEEGLAGYTYLED
jgi:arginine decarboxylase